MRTSDSLFTAPEPVFRIWRHREIIEIEAASVFEKLAHGLSSLWGQSDAVARLAHEASVDEHRHSERCREILSASPHPFVPIAPDLGIELGARNLSLEDKVLYGCVAMGCVTETLSTALLVEMHKVAGNGKIKETIHEILADEINHSRIGWAELARAANRRKVSWLKPHIAAMIQAAIVSDVSPMLNATEGKLDLSQWGILSPKRANEIMATTVDRVILPGLKKFNAS